MRLAEELDWKGLTVEVQRVNELKHNCFMKIYGKFKN
jgi:hypothetical protein